MSSTNEKRAARSIVEREGIPYTMALRLLREAKKKEPDRSWAALAKYVRAE